MENIEYKKEKLKLYKINAGAITIMLLASAIGYSFINANIGARVEIGKLSVREGFWLQLYVTFGTPMILVILIGISLLFRVGDKEKNAVFSNISKIIKINIMMVMLLAFVHIALLIAISIPREISLNNPDTFLKIINFSLGLMTIYLGNLAGKMNRSLLSGWPTPWNLKSDLAWQKSQRFMGFALYIVGTSTCIAAIFWLDWFWHVTLGGMLIAYLGCAIVSYYVYSQEQYYNQK